MANYSDIFDAALHGDLAAVQQFEADGVDVNTKLKRRRKVHPSVWLSIDATVLHGAAISGNLELVDYLVEQKQMKVNQGNRVTPLGSVKTQPAPS